MGIINKLGREVRTINRYNKLSRRRIRYKRIGKGG